MARKFAIREFHSSDLVMLYRICLETGDDGGDATGQIDADLLGHFYAGPYAVLEPELCFILTRDGAPCGYILGTADSIEFAGRCEREWWDPLRAKYALPDRRDRSREAMVIRELHSGYQAPELASDYPAHLHIDLLPEGQGVGQGPYLIDRFLKKLGDDNVKGIHLDVSRGNERAMTFYPKLGFKLLKESTAGVTYGMKL